MWATDPIWGDAPAVEAAPQQEEQEPIRIGSQIGNPMFEHWLRRTLGLDHPNAYHEAEMTPGAIQPGSGDTYMDGDIEVVRPEAIANARANPVAQGLRGYDAFPRMGQKGNMNYDVPFNYAALGTNAYDFRENNGATPEAMLTGGFHGGQAGREFRMAMGLRRDALPEQLWNPRVANAFQEPQKAAMPDPILNYGPGGAQAPAGSPLAQGLRSGQINAERRPVTIDWEGGGRD